jgi:signal transduction histidine kinase
MFLSWALSVAFVLASVVHIGIWLDLWTILYSVLFLCVAFTYDKFARLNFLESKRTALIESSRRELLYQIYEAKRSSMQRAHELELILIQTEDEKKLIDKERDALTALIGNVAHDLKTPLQSFVLDLELLKMRITKDYTRMSPGYSIDEDDDHPLNTLRSLNSACDFMRMAINRSIDFAKASGNIALVPAMETFNIVAALTIPVNVIKHLQSAINIVVNPLPVNLCENLISDKHWFSENILCLLSNAVKYSDGGTVTVNIELLEQCGLENEAEAAMNSEIKSEINVDVNDQPLCALRVSIEDTGIGLSEDARDKLFQPFKQV